jgi:hemerythrin-like domain-containing protein
MSGGIALARKHEASNDQKPEVTAAEDLMREHGILRRALIVYSEVVPRLRTNATSVPAKALADTAKLFRRFGENYHEKMLEEAHVFPVVQKLKGNTSAYPDILQKQHERGREITDYVLSSTAQGAIGASSALRVADALAAFVRMYEPYAAMEDTVVFPAWKGTFSRKTFEEISDKFEEIEHSEFGADGFEDARKQIAAIEAELGLSDLNIFTAPKPA